GTATLDQATLGLPSLAKPVSIAHMSMKFAQDSASIGDLALNIGGSNITGNMSMKNFGAPQVTFAINADKLDVAQLQAAEGPSTAGAPPKKKGPSMIEKVTAKGTLNAGQLISHGLTLTQVKATLDLNHGVAKLAPLSAGLFGGTVNGSVQT